MATADDLLDDLIVLPPDRAAALAGISRRQLVYWDLRGLVGPGIARRLSVRGNVQLYTFTDLICLCVLAQIRRRFSLQRMRKVVAHLRSRGYDEPLAELRFALLGRHEIYFQHPDGTWEGDLQSDQIVLHEVIQLDPIRALIRQATRRAPGDFGKIERRRGRRASLIPRYPLHHKGLSRLVCVRVANPGRIRPFLYPEAKSPTRHAWWRTRQRRLGRRGNDAAPRGTPVRDGGPDRSGSGQR